MVFFTCNHCGESVKKPSVEKHYYTKCRGAPKSVSCMDCQKDFQDNYVEHTKCITEMEKYSGKDYVPKESQNSGAKKQEGWTEVVRSVLNSQEHTLGKDTKKAFLMLQNYDNIPRKKAKFLNFVTNSVHLPRHTVEEVWNILEKEQEKMKQARQAQLASAQKGNGGVKAKESVKEAVADELDEEPKKKKNKDKVNDDDEENKQMTTETEVNGHVEGSKKKKKKHREIDNAEEANVEPNMTNGYAEIESSKKKKKKQKANEESALVELSQQNGHTEEGKKQKQKHKNEETTESYNIEPPTKKQKENESNENDTSSLETQSRKKKHKEVKQNGFGEDEPAVKKQKIVQGNDATQENSSEEYHFCWDTELARITQKYPDGLTMAKLKKKLLKKFKTKFVDTEFGERQEKGFEKKLNKKLKKIATLQVEGDLVKACS